MRQSIGGFATTCGQDSRGPTDSESYVRVRALGWHARAIGRHGTSEIAICLLEMGQTRISPSLGPKGCRSINHSSHLASSKSQEPKEDQHKVSGTSSVRVVAIRGCSQAGFQGSP